MNLFTHDLLDCIDFGFIATDQNDRVTYLNRFALKSFDIPAAWTNRDIRLVHTECHEPDLEQWRLLRLQLADKKEPAMQSEDIERWPSTSLGPKLARLCKRDDSTLQGSLYCLPGPSIPPSIKALPSPETRKVVHDACQPLTAIINFAMGLLLAHRCGTLESEVLTTSLESIQNEAIRASKIIKGFAKS